MHRVFTSALCSSGRSSCVTRTLPSSDFHSFFATCARVSLHTRSLHSLLHRSRELEANVRSRTSQCRMHVTSAILVRVFISTPCSRSSSATRTPLNALMWLRGWIERGRGKEGFQQPNEEEKYPVRIPRVSLVGLTSRIAHRR